LAPYAATAAGLVPTVILFWNLKQELHFRMNRERKRVDQMLERAKQVTRNQWTYVEYARFADDLVILADSHPRWECLRQAIDKRLREELAKLDVEVNEEKSRRVDLRQGGSFGFLGFEFRRILSRRGRWMPLRIPKSKKRTALLRQLKEIFRHSRSQPVNRLIEKINPILRGWVNYFAIGNSSRCFSYLRDWVDKKIRSHLARACQRRGASGGSGGAKNGCMGHWACLTSIGCPTIPLRTLPLSVGLITLDLKCAGARNAGNPHATCDVAGVGDEITEPPKRARKWKRRKQPRKFLRIYAPALDPTTGIKAGYDRKLYSGMG